MMKKVFSILALLCFLGSTISAQVAINANGNPPDASSMLDIQSTTGGFLPPRMTTVERDAISNPATGLTIYNTTTNCTNVYNGAQWTKLCGCVDPGTPAAGAASGVSSSDFTANWATASDADDYLLDVSTQSNFSAFVSGYNGVSTGNVTSYAVSGLSCGTTYYYRVRATNDCGTGANSSVITVNTNACVFICGTSSVTDVEGNSYTTIQMGSQCWMRENMRTTKYPNGSSITKGDVTNNAPSWSSSTSQYSCPPDASNTAEDCAAAQHHGMLYQWSAAMNGSTTAGAQGICPNGWHVPTDAEWCTLESYLGMSNPCSTVGWRGTNQGSQLASHSPIQNYNSGALVSDGGFDSSNFDVYPTGARSVGGNYQQRGSNPTLWSSNENGGSAWSRYLAPSLTTVKRDNSEYKEFGGSVRCLKD